MSQNQTRKILKRTKSSFYVLNCFECFQIYILGHLRKLNQVFMCQNVLALLSKNQFYFFFLTFGNAKIPPSVRIPRYWP